MAESLINWGKIKGDEGFETKSYILDNPDTVKVEFEKSGITMLGGIDLGQGTYNEIVNAIDGLGLTSPEDKATIASVKTILKEMDGKKGQAATDLYKKLTAKRKDGSSRLDVVTNFFVNKGQSIQDNFNVAKEVQVKNAYNALAKKHGGTLFEDLDEGWRTVMASAYFQYGSKQGLLKQVAKGDKAGAIKNLKAWGDTTGGKGSTQATAIDKRYANYGSELETTELVINPYTPGTYNHAFKRAKLEGRESFEWVNPETNKTESHKVEYKEPVQTSSLDANQVFDMMNNEFDFNNIPYEDEGEITYG